MRCTAPCRSSPGLLALVLAGLATGAARAGQAPPPRVPPAPDPGASPLVQRLYAEKCAPLHPDREVLRLGSLEAEDAPTGERFAFVVCRRRDLNTGAWDVIIQSNRALGAGLTREEAERKAREAGRRRLGHVTFGLPLHPLGPLDHRRIEYRLHQERGRPVALEIVVVLRDAARRARPPRALRVPWPAER